METNIPDESEKEKELIKPEDIHLGEAEAVAAMANEEAEDEYEDEYPDYAELACNMAIVLNNIGEVDMKMFSPSEQTRIAKAKTQALKLLCHAMEELKQEYFPKPQKNDPEP